jgi:hypothetical protein
VSLVLDPKEKMGYFKKHWSTDLQDDVDKCAEAVVWSSFSALIHKLIHYQFKEQWLLLSGGLTVRSSVQSKKGKGLHALLQELSDEEDEMVGMGLDVPEDPQRPWLCDYWAYMDVLEQMLEGWTVIQWWGVSISISIS